jgi:23S rRNA pseudouridine2457 synthase
MDADASRPATDRKVVSVGSAARSALPDVPVTSHQSLVTGTTSHESPVTKNTTYGSPVTGVILFNKPYGVVCQFSPHAARPTLKQFIQPGGVYPAGRLDWDSEGLVVLTGDGALQHRISDPRAKMPKTYWVQVEGVIGETALRRLREGVHLGEFTTLPAGARRIGEPSRLWVRTPPIRVRRAIPTSWLELTLREGKNRQVRRMTAAVGHPTLRLVRWRVGPWDLQGIAPGEHRHLAAGEVE